MPNKKVFLTDVKLIRSRARAQMEKGAVTQGYGADRKKVIEILNEALATEIICVLRYSYHHYKTSGIHARSVAAEFLEHAQEEMKHASRIAERITQLNGKPNFSPDGLLSRSHSEYVEGGDLVEMIEEDLVAERIAIDTYREIVQYLGNDDPTTHSHRTALQALHAECAPARSALQSCNHSDARSAAQRHHRRDSETCLNANWWPVRPFQLRHHLQRRPQSDQDCRTLRQTHETWSNPTPRLHVSILASPAIHDLECRPEMKIA